MPAVSRIDCQPFDRRRDRDFGAGVISIALRLRDHHRIGRVARRRGDGDVHPHLRRAEHQRVGHVVAVADVGDLLSLQIAEVLPRGEVVGHGLAGVREVGEAVDDGDARVLGEVGDGLVREGARHDAVDVAREDFRGVVDRLAAAELDVARGEEEGVAAELEHAGLERDARARRRLLEDHGQGLAAEGVAVALRILLDVAGQLEDLPHVVGAVVVDLDEVFVLHGGGYYLPRS